MTRRACGSVIGSTASPRRARRACRLARAAELSTHGRRLGRRDSGSLLCETMGWGSSSGDGNNEGCCTGRGGPVPRLARRVSSRNNTTARTALPAPLRTRHSRRGRHGQMTRIPRGLQGPTIDLREAASFKTPARGLPELPASACSTLPRLQARRQGLDALHGTVARKGCLALGPSDGAAPRRAGRRLRGG